MLEIRQIKLPCGTGPEELMDKRIRRILRLDDEVRFSWRITRHSVDARYRPELYDVYSVCVSFTDGEKCVPGAVPGAVRVRRPGGGKGAYPSEQELVKRLHDRNVTIHREEPYRFPTADSGAPALRDRPVVVGFGPAGIFCALMLARAGYCPVVLERGQRMEERIRTVDRFWSGGCLQPDSNIQFGEGGAGTFSDGKLNSNVSERSGRNAEVLRTFVRAGAPEDILTEQIPHIGTDRLRRVIPAIREEILSLGGEIYFDTRVTELVVCGERIAGVRFLRAGEEREESLPCTVLVLAPGHSARDLVRTLRRRGVPMEPKDFAVGFRVSHPQSMINASRYGISNAGQIRRLGLEPAAYRLTCRAGDGRGVYSFCMCPGGYVVNASSEYGRLAVNGMSDYRRDAARANSAIVMTVSQKDFAALSADPVLSGMFYQERLEERAHALCGGRVPVQRFASFEREIVDTQLPDSDALCVRGRTGPGALHTLLPRDLTRDFTEGMHVFGHRVRGFDGPEAYVIGLESRTSSPVRILRDETGQSAVRGLYPCGEGAGYAGGIMSAAVDGIRSAEHIARAFRPGGAG